MTMRLKTPPPGPTADTLPRVSSVARTPLHAIRNPAITILAVTASTLLARGFEQLGFPESTFVMAYLSGVVFVAYATVGYRHSIAASAIGVLAFNFFFTNPHFTFRAYGPGYPATFAVMLLAAVVASGMTARVNALKRQAEQRERWLRFLNRLGHELTLADGFERIAETAADGMARFLDASALVAVVDDGSAPKHRHCAGTYPFDRLADEVAYLDALRAGAAGTTPERRIRSSPDAHFLAIGGPGKVLGALGVALPDRRPLTENGRTFLDTVAAQIALALEGDRQRRRQEEARLATEKERLRSSLLRGVSHDLRTPLTGILGAADTLQEHFAALSDAEKLALVRDIGDEAGWLANLVENTLCLTRLDEDRIRLNREPHPVEELVAAAAERCRKRADGRRIAAEVPPEFLEVSADATLVVQALINLLDNALRHSPPGGTVRLRVTAADGATTFEVADEGPGFDPREKERLFDRFHTEDKDIGSGRRPHGLGLGLSVCRSIALAHGGAVSAENLPEGGAVFRLALPTESP